MAADSALGARARRNPGCDPQTLRRLAEFAHCRRGVAQNPNCDATLLQRLSQSPDVGGPRRSRRERQHPRGVASSSMPGF